MTVLSKHAGSNLVHAGGSYEPQRLSNFALVIAGLPEIEKVILTTKSVTVPGARMTKQTIKYFNESVHYAGAVEPFQSATCVFRDYLDVDTIRVLSQWYRQVWNPDTGAIGYAADYKKQGELFLLPPGIKDPRAPGAVSAGAFQNRMYKFFGVFPENLEIPQLDHDNPGANLEITLTLSVDKAIPISMLG